MVALSLWHHVGCVECDRVSAAEPDANLYEQIATPGRPRFFTIFHTPLRAETHFQDSDDENLIL